jgi:hypothetical protein
MRNAFTWAAGSALAVLSIGFIGVPSSDAG